MGDTLRRWLWAQETTSDDIGGAVLTGVAIVLIFRFLFGDSWEFSLVGGLLVALASFAVSRWSRRRTRARTTGL